MLKALMLSIFMILTGVLPVLASDRFSSIINLPSGQSVVVSEGEHEARSIGSFSIRLYEAASAGDETTFFISGLIQSRDGIIEKVILSDLNGDEQLEIVVIVRSVGTGSHLSAHAYSVEEGRKLVLFANVEGMPSMDNPIETLKKLKRK